VLKSLSTLQPVPQSERLIHIDMIRGVAILGILLVNMAHFSYPDLYLYIIGPDNFFMKDWGALDTLTDQLLSMFVQMKFITMFSFLFGFGMILMMERAIDKRQNFVLIYMRRLLISLLFGFIHAFLIWDGDILTEYALLGFVLLLFRNRKPKTILTWTIIFYLLFLIPVAMMTFLPTSETPEMTAWNESFINESERNAKQALQVYSEGSNLEIAQQRIYDRKFYMSLNGMASLNPILYFYSNIPYFCMFLLGAYFAKKRYLHRPAAHQSVLKKLWIISLLIGLPTNIAYAIANNEAFLLLGAPFLMLFYVISIIFLMKLPLTKRLLTPFAAVGKTALSNYILQSILATTIFYSYGLGLYGSVKPFLALFISIGIFAFQLIISNIWIRHFRYGPLEYIWRVMTYRKIMPLNY